MAAITEASLAQREGRIGNLGAVRREADAMLSYYEGWPQDRVPPEMAVIAKDGLRLSLQFQELLQSLGVSKTDDLYCLYDELADHAEVVALSNDPETIEPINGTQLLHRHS